ncbi:MAG: hypothetical protein ACI30R_08440 [Sodaliphilus sp.]
MKVIAESSSTRTEWALVQGDKIIEHAYTEGLNPFFQTRREISHIIRLGLPPEFFKRRWSHVYYYGAGCSSPEKNKIVESSLVAQFKTPVTVDSDLVGATRGLLVHEPGLACILGTGSNSCLYDGHQIIKRVRSGGYILGDEGSGAAMGRLFIGDLLKGFVPMDIRNSFVDKFNLTVDLLMDEVYNNPHANRNLRNYGVFLSEHLQNDYVYHLVFNEISRFFERTILQYDYQNYPISFVGSVACQFSEVLLSVAAKYGANIKKIVRASMPGLVTYHTGD